MQPELLTIILSILGAIGTWTVTVALLVLWLANRFRAIERTIYIELTKFKREIDGDIMRVEKRMRLIELALYRLQLKVFGFAPMDMQEMVSKLNEVEDEL